LFAGGSWLPVRATTAIAVAAGTTANTGDLTLDTERAGNIRVQQIVRGRANSLRPVRIACSTSLEALAGTSDELGQAWFEDVPARTFGFIDGRPIDPSRVYYGQSAGFLAEGRRWLDTYQFFDQRSWYVGARNTLTFATDSLGAGGVSDAALIRGTPPGEFLGYTEENGAIFVQRDFSGRATATLRTEHDGRVIIHAFSFERPDGEHLELPLQRALRTPLGAFDRHGLVSGTLLGADAANEHRLRSTRRLDVQEWWDDVVEGIPVSSSMPIDVDPAVTHGPFEVGVAMPSGNLAAVEITSPGGVATLQKAGIAVGFEPVEGSLVQRDLPLDLAPTGSFTLTGALAGADPLVDVTQMRLDLALGLPDGPLVDVVRGLGGNHMASGDDLLFTLPPLLGSLQGQQWLAVLQGSFANGAETLHSTVFATLDQSVVAGSPLLPFPVVTSPAPGATVPAAAFTVDFALPAGSLYGIIELRREAGNETLLWQAFVPPEQTQFAFGALPPQAATPLFATLTYTLTVSAYFGTGVVAQLLAPYRDLSPFIQSIGHAERGITQVSRRSFQVTLN
jgi:hypothetical protein